MSNDKTTTSLSKRKTNCEYCKKRLKWKNDHGYANVNKSEQRLIIICKKCFEKENKKYTLIADTTTTTIDNSSDMKKE